jgi:hypothetical protein
MSGRIFILRDETLNGESGIRELAAVFGNLEGSLCDNAIESVVVALKESMPR